MASWKAVSVTWAPGDRVMPRAEAGRTSRRGVVAEVVLRENDTPLYYVQWDDALHRMKHCVDPDELRAAPTSPKGYLNLSNEGIVGTTHPVPEIPCIVAAYNRLAWGEDLHKRKCAEKKRKAWRK